MSAATGKPGRRRPHIQPQIAGEPEEASTTSTANANAGSTPASTTNGSSGSEAGPDAATQAALEEAELNRSATRTAIRVLLLFFAFVFAPIYLYRNHFAGGKLPSFVSFGSSVSASKRVLTVEELSAFDGEGGRPLYLAIMGDVYDVSSGGRGHYGKGMAYSGFAGRDGSRAYVTGCYTKRGLTHDVRGLNVNQLKAITEWADFYRNHKTYRFVGRVQLPTISDADPLPDDCNGKIPPDEESAAATKAAIEKGVDAQRQLDAAVQKLKRQAIERGDNPDTAVADAMARGAAPAPAPAPPSDAAAATAAAPAAPATPAATPQ